MSPRHQRSFQWPWRKARQIREDVNAELAFHLEMRIDALVRAGESREAARAKALAEFGDLDDARQYIAEVDGAAETARRHHELARDLRQDVRYAIRTMRSAPGFAAAVVSTLALGIGATTAIYSIVSAVLLKPLPFPEPDRIVRVFQVDAKGNRESVSQANFIDWTAETHVFSAIALWGGTPSNALLTPSGPVIANVATVTRDFFTVLGIRPALGRLFTPEETRFGGPRAAIISDNFWRARFAGSTDVIGQSLTQEHDRYVIVGVLPPSATFPADNDVWIPIALFPPVLGRTAQGYRVIARIKPGVSPALAREDVSAVSRRLKQQYGNQTSMSDATIVGLREQLVGDVRARLVLLLAASGLLLLIGLANALNLLLARMALRQSELAVRAALGATRWRLTRQMLVESALLVTIASLAGLGIATISVRAIVVELASALPRATEVSVDWSVLTFAVVLSAALAAAMGLLATSRGARRDVRDSLSASPRGVASGAMGARFRRGMVVLQLALTVVLLIGSTIFGLGFLQLLDVHPGFATERVVVVSASPLINDKLERLAYYSTLVERAGSLPGVSAAGAASGVPIAVSAPGATYLLLDNPTQHITPDDWANFPPSRKGRAEYRVVLGDYFHAMTIPLLRGRLFELHDGPDAPPVAVVSALFAKQAWPNEDPIGKLVEYGNMDGDLRPFTVVGIVGDVRHESLAQEPAPTFYANLPQRPAAASTMALVVRTDRRAASIVPSIRAIVHDLRPDVAVRAETMESVIATSVADRRFTLLVITAFGAAALLLATLGVYSLVSYLVAQRTREIGVRVALGATRGDVLRLIVGEALRLALAGIAVGVIVSLALARVVRGLIFGVSPTDPAAFAGVTVALIAIVFVAAYLPGHRATRIDPARVLRGA